MKKFLLFVSVSVLVLLVATYFVARSLKDVGSEVLADLVEAEQVDPLLEAAIESPLPEAAKPELEAEPAVSKEEVAEEAVQVVSKPDPILDAIAEREKWLELVTLESVSGMLAELESNLDVPDKVARRQQLFRRWGELDGEGAFVAAHGYDSRTASGLISAAAEGWAKVEPSLAWEALMQASNHGALPGVQLGPVLREIARQDLPHALSLLGELPVGAKQEFAFRDLMMGRQSPDTHETLLLGTLQMEDKALQARLSKVLYEDWSRTDFDQALSSLSGIPDSNVSRSALSGLLSTWARTDGAAAFDYAAELGDSSASIDALTGVAKVWLRSSNSVEADDIITRIADSPHSSELISALAFELAAANPQRTLELAESISDQRVRSFTESKVIARWAGNDVVAAESYVNSLTDEKRIAGYLPNILRARLGAGMDLEPVAQTLLSFESAKDRARVVRAAQLLVGRSSQTDAEVLQSFLELFPDETGPDANGNPAQGSIVIREKL